MKETIFEQVASAASVLKLDLSAEEFALFAEDREFSEAGMEAVQMLLGYLSEKKQQTTIQTLLNGNDFRDLEKPDFAGFLRG